MQTSAAIPREIAERVRRLSAASRTVRLAVTSFRNTYLTPNGLRFPHALDIELEHLDYILDHIQLLVAPEYIVDAEDQPQRSDSPREAGAA